MNELLKPGQSIRTDKGDTCQVEKFLGGGGQGEVYRVNWQGKPYALKWYFEHTATSGQLNNLRILVDKGVPNPRFLWPLEIVTQAGLPGYGYLMSLRESNYTGIIDLMKSRVEPSFRALATAGFQLADCYLQLHSRGFCYCDISFGNVFWNPTTGDVLICDNDNVIVNGQKPEIGGTMGFMAPEVTTGAATPSIDTDKHSLAVLLFYMFMVHNPLEGMRESAIRSFDMPGKVKVYGHEPIFIFDPNDHSNRPDPRYHKPVLNLWPIYPQFLRNLFTKAFTIGLKDARHGRVTETEWKATMVKLQDSILYCGQCQCENFYDAEAIQAANGTAPKCWGCKQSVILPFRIRIGKSVTMLNYDTKLFPHHVNDNLRFDFTAPVAEVTRHPQDHSKWGLRNLSPEKWVLTASDGTVRDVESGRAAPLMNGSRINFGGTEGEIRF